MTNNMTGTEVDTNGQILSPQKTRTHTHGVFWQQIKRGRTVIPRGITEERRQAGSLDSRGMAENKERDGALAQNKFCQELVLQGLYLHGEMGGKKQEYNVMQRELFKG